MPVIFITVLGEISITSWSNDQAIKWGKAFRSVCCAGEGQSRSNRKMERSIKWKKSGCIRLIKMRWESMEKQLNSSWKNSQDLRHCRFLEHPARRVQGPNHHYVNVEWYWLKENDENCISNAEKVKNYAMKFPQGHWTFLGSGMEVLLTIRKERGILQPTKMLQRLKETGHLVFKSITALSRGILEQKKGKSTIHFNGDSMNTQLMFQTVHSSNQLSIYGAVANWWYQFSVTEEERWRAKFSVDNKMLTCLQLEEVQLLVSLPTITPRNRMGENVFELRSTDQWNTAHTLMWKTYFQHRVAAGKQNKILPDEDDGWR